MKRSEEIEKELRELGSALPTQADTPLGVPDGYFSGLSDRILNAVAQESITEDSLPRVGLPYEAPTGYFEEFPARMAEKAAGGKKRGVLISFSSLRWAAAAVVVMMIGAASYQMLHTEVSVNTQSGWLSSVDDEDIQEYLGYAAHTTVRPHSDLGTLDVGNEDIVDFLDETGWEETVY